MSDEASRLIHPDWPPVEAGKRWWELSTPIDDLQASLEQAVVLPADTGSLSIDMVASVERYAISHNGSNWEPGDDGGTELSLFVVGTLVDGRWFGVEAWNDYTGWGCQDGSDAYVGATEDDVVAHGLTNDARSALGYPVVSA